MGGGGGEGHVSAMVRFDTVPRLALGMSGGMDSGRSGPTCLLASCRFVRNIGCYALDSFDVRRFLGLGQISTADCGFTGLFRLA